jgi:hypothetical protein
VSCLSFVSAFSTGNKLKFVTLQGHSGENAKEKEKK